MKTFKEFLYEALKSSVVRAAARQQYTSKAVTQRVGGGRSSGSSPGSITTPEKVKLASKITGFQTGRGSKYTYNPKQGSWPQTQRTAAKDPYHPTAPGVKQKSDYTMFTTPDASMKMRQNFVSKGAVNQQTKEPFFKDLPKSTTPKKGRAPVEVWNKYAEKGGKQAIHPGSPIKDIQTTTRGSNVGLYGTQRKEIKQRVNTALKKPQNRSALRTQSGMKPRGGGSTSRSGNAGTSSGNISPRSASERSGLPGSFRPGAAGSGSMMANSYEPDLYGIILSHLLDEGYAETPEAAQAIMVNMSEEWREFISELTQSELDVEAKKVNQNTRNAPIQRQQPPSQPDGTPQRPTGVPIPGTGMAFKKATDLVRAGVSATVNR
jgi:hypothetical protein